MLETIVKLVNEGKDISVIVAIIILGSLFNIEKISDFLDKYTNKELMILKNLFGEKVATGKIQAILQDKIDSIIFRHLTGISAEKYLREAIINLHELAGGRLKYIHFKHSLVFLRIDDNDMLRVRNFKWFEVGYYWFNRGASFLFFCLALIGFIVIIFYSDFSKNSFLQISSLLDVLILFSSAIFLYSQTLPLEAARKIKNEIIEIYRGKVSNSSEVTKPI